MRNGGLEAQGWPGTARAKANERDVRARLYRRIRHFHRWPNPRLRRVRIPGIARRQFCTAGLRIKLAELPRAGRLPYRLAQLPTDRLLLGIVAGARRTSAWRRSAPRRCQHQLMGSPARA